jgi:hypothetical protein
MTSFKTSFAITLFVCFFSVKTNAQVGVTMYHVKKSVMYKPQNNPFKLKPHPLNLPKVSYAENPYYQRQGANNALFGGVVDAIFDKRSSPLERVAGSAFWIFCNVVK